MAQLARTAGLLQSSAAAEPSVSRRAKHSLRRDVELRERESGAASQRSSFEGWRGPAEWVGPAGDAPAWSGSADWADTAPEAPEARLSSSSSAGAVFDDGTEAVEEEGEAAWEGAGEDRDVNWDSEASVTEWLKKTLVSQGVHLKKEEVA